MKDRIAYLISSTARGLTGAGRRCPSCGSAESTVVSRKYLVTSLRRCTGCRLMFRYPADSPSEAFEYYQETYSSGFTTDLPGEGQLAHYLEGGFSGTPKDFSRYVAILRALGVGEGSRVLDFGCSWGYGVWQFAQCGFDAYGFELSRPRARFAREQLKVNAVSDVASLVGEFDVVFSSHVLEHIAQLEETLDWVFPRLRPGGLMIAVTPNGSPDYRALRPDSWQRSWGLKHPLLLDGEYWISRLAERSYFLTSDLSDEVSLGHWAGQGSRRLGRLDGPELLVAVRN